MKFKTKIIIPILLLMIIFSFITINLLKNKFSEYDSLVELNTQVILATKISELMHEIQLERGTSVAYILNKKKLVKKELIKQYLSTDLYYKDILKYLKYSNLIKSNNKSLDFLNSKILQDRREDIVSLKLTESNIIKFYSSINSKLLNIIIDISNSSNTKIISQNINAYINFLYSKEYAGLERALGVNILSNNNKNHLIINKFSILISKQDLHNELFFKHATDELKHPYKDSFKSKDFEEVLKMRKVILNSSKINSFKINVDFWFNQLSKKINHLKTIDDLLSKNILSLISNKRTKTSNELILFNTLGLIAFFIAIFMIYLLIKFTKHEEQLRAIIDKNVIYSTTDLRGIIIESSEAFCKISKYKKHELIGKPHNIVRHEDMTKEAFNNMWETIKKGDTWEGEVKNRKSDGSYYWVIATISPIYSYGKMVAYTSTRQDITDKKKIEELNKNLENRVTLEVNKSQEKDKQLAQQARLAQMGEMISMIAHQWRQPLASISSLSIALNLKAQLGKLNKEITLDLSSKITENSKHLSETINDFRDFFRPNKEQRNTSFNEIIKNVLNIVEGSITTKNIQIIKELNCDKSFLTYPNEIKQVVLNLIKNADDALGEKGIENPYIKLLTYSTNDEIILEINDNAGGIPDNIIDKVFDPYFSTKTKKDGTGLGLYMSKTIIEKHCDGKLSVNNSESGAVFKIKMKKTSS